MDTNTLQKLIDLNQQFYQTFALQFSATRMRLQPGAMLILDKLSSEKNILDLGCGNGEIALALSRTNHYGSYTGLDFNDEMLNITRERVNENTYSSTLKVNLLKADLTTSNWIDVLPQPQYDAVLALAVLHHIPGNKLRRNLIKTIRKLLKEKNNSNYAGRFYLSNWQFLNSPRLRNHIVPWETVGLTSKDVEDGDYLIDWRSGGYGIRYVHHFDEYELATIAVETGFNLKETFFSDGDGGILGLYQIWEIE